MPAGAAEMLRRRGYALAKVTFVHRHGPAQFTHLAGELARQGHDVTLLCETSDLDIAGVRVIKHAPVGSTEGQTSVDYQIRVGTKAAQALDIMRRKGDIPDIIVGHVGWGSLLFAKDIFPTTPMLGYCEFYYRARGADVGFDKSDAVTIEDIVRVKSRNFAQLATIPEIDAGISPTSWQRDGYPGAIARQIGVIHEGIDTQACAPDPSATIVLPNGRKLTAGDPVVTFAARDLEPYRGFHQFMRAAAILADRDPRVIFVVAGGHGASYGSMPAGGRTWRDVMMEETGLDPSRIHFLGTVPHAYLIRMFQVSAAHVYLTYPFVLSWSMLEAMSAGVLLVASNTAPVSEFVTNGNNGLLVPFFDPALLASALAEAIANDKHRSLRDAARRTVIERVELRAMLKRQIRLLDRLMTTRSGVGTRFQG